MSVELAKPKDSGPQSERAPTTAHPAKEPEQGFQLGKIDLGAPLRAVQEFFDPHSKDKGKDRETAPHIAALTDGKVTPLVAAHTSTAPSTTLKPEDQRNFLQRSWDEATQKGQEILSGAAELLDKAGEICRKGWQSVTTAAEQLAENTRKFLKPATDWLAQQQKNIVETCQRALQDPMGLVHDLFENIADAANNTIAKLRSVTERSAASPAADKLTDLINFPRLSSAMPTPPSMSLTDQGAADQVQEIAEFREHFRKRMEEIWSDLVSSLEAKEKEAKQKEELLEEEDHRTFLGGDVPELVEKLRDIASVHPELQKLLLGWASELEGRGLMPREWVSQIAIDGLLASVEHNHHQQAA